LHKDYSHRDVTDKLGLKPGLAVRVVGLGLNAPGARDLLERVRAKVGRALVRKGPADVILYWPRMAEELAPRLTVLRSEIVPAGGIWVVTAKRNCTSASGMAYFNQDHVIPLGAAAGLVDNKICSLSECESAMRFVIRKRDRVEK
jgi:hypothetical protein